MLKHAVTFSLGFSLSRRLKLVLYTSCMLEIRLIPLLLFNCDLWLEKIKRTLCILGIKSIRSIWSIDLSETENTISITSHRHICTYCNLNPILHFHFPVSPKNSTILGLIYKRSLWKNLLFYPCLGDLMLIDWRCINIFGSTDIHL